MGVGLALQVCSRDRGVYLCFPGSFINARLLPLDQIVKGLSGGGENVIFPSREGGAKECELVDSDSDAPMEDDEALTSHGEGILKTKPKDKPCPDIEAGSDAGQVFCRCMKNPYRHLTLQGQKPKDFDVLTQVYKQVVDNGQMEPHSDLGIVFLQHHGQDYACNLLDLRAEDLLSNLHLWELKDVKISLRTVTPVALSGIGMSKGAKDLLQHMANTKAIKGPANWSFESKPYYHPLKDQSVKALLRDGFIERAAGDGFGGPGPVCSFWITAKGASVLQVMQVVGSKVTLAEYQRNLG